MGKEQTHRGMGARDRKITFHAQTTAQEGDQDVLLSALRRAAEQNGYRVGEAFGTTPQEGWVEFDAICLEGDEEAMVASVTKTAQENGYTITNVEDVPVHGRKQGEEVDLRSQLRDILDGPDEEMVDEDLDL